MCASIESCREGRRAERPAARRASRRMGTMNMLIGGRMALMLAMPPLVAVTACSGGEDDGGGRVAEAIGGVVGLERTPDSDFVAIREIWLALADEPATHMRLARQALAAGHLETAARELDKSATLFRWGEHYAFGERERRDFLATAQELEESARLLREGSERGTEPLFRVMSMSYRALAEHQAAAALREWEAGEHVRVALLLDAAATDIEQGFALSGETAGGSIDAAVADARAVAHGLDSKQPPSEAMVRDAIQGLERAAQGLGEVLGSRRH